jgi:hypothetical protein
MKLIPIVSSLSAAALLTSCSTIVSGTSEDVHIRSTPSGANVKVNGVTRGVTPAEFELSRRQNHTVLIELPGYKPHQVELKKTFNPWILGNLFVGGLIGIVVDLSTGAVYKLDPYEVNATLEPLPGGRGSRRTTMTSQGGVLISTTLAPKAHWQKIGQLERL